MPKGIYIRTEKSFGHTPWNKGLDWKPKSAFRKGEKGAFMGKKHTEESKLKMSKHLRGLNTKEKNPNWKGGIKRKHTGSDYNQRRMFRQEIQKLVFERDNYTCQLCGARGVDLQVDHIQSWAEYIELRFSMSNCRTLCARCHYKITFGKEMPKTVKGWGHNLLERERIAK